MTEILKLLAEIKDSNNAILELTKGTRKPTDDEVGTINNHACDVAYFLGRVEIIAQAKADAGKCQKLPS